MAGNQDLRADLATICAKLSVVRAALAGLVVELSSHNAVVAGLGEMVAEAMTTASGALERESRETATDDADGEPAAVGLLTAADKGTLH